MTMSRACLIPARGGSKRLSRKNIADFLGKPIIAHTIEAARSSGLFSRIAVSTEDREIARIARDWGAEWHERPPELAADGAHLIDVCLGFLEDEEQIGRHYDTIGCLLATAPMREATDVRGVHDMLEPGLCDFAMAVTTYDLPPLQALRRTPDGFLEPMWPEFTKMRSQDAPQLYVDNGSTYIAETGALRREHTFYGQRLRGYLMPRERSVDIDEAFDLELARRLAETSAL